MCDPRLAEGEVGCRIVVDEADDGKGPREHGGQREDDVVEARGE